MRNYSRKKLSSTTLHQNNLGEQPWSKVGVDLFNFDDKKYLVTVDYNSNFREIDSLENNNTKATQVIRKPRHQFARHGISDEVMSDNGPQFTSEQFKQFSKTWEFEHVRSV